MSPALCRLSSRLLLAVMLLTFLSPGFGWQVVAGHALLNHPETASAAVHPAHDHAGTHAGDHADDERPGAHGHDHEDAHSMAGHVLSHMPATHFHTAVQPVLPHQPVMQGAELPLFLPQSPPDQPYRPPQALPV